LPSATTLNKPLRDLLQQRLGLLTEFDKVSQALDRATHPVPPPEQQAADAKKELERLEESQTTSFKVPESLLPASFRHSSGSITQEMKDDLEATTNELKEDKAKLETLADELGKWDGLQKSRRAERDKAFQRVANMKTKAGERKSGGAESQSPEARVLAQQRSVNLEWEAKLEALRLKLIEAQLALDAKRIHVTRTSKEILQLRVLLAEKALKQMREMYRVMAENRERNLQQAAVKEEKKARATQDPLESLRARRTAELLSLEVLVVKNEQALATNPSPSLLEQRGLADRAEAEFAEIKKLLDDGRVSRLDAIRLTNDFRRIGVERERLLRNEMATVEAHVRYYEDALTSVELSLLQDSQRDRFELDLLRERLRPSRWGEAEALLTELEQKQRALLGRRRDALEKLSERAGLTLQQVTRRLSTLDEEYGFIRTHIFWVRDQDAIGLATLELSGREFKHFIKGLLRLAQETINLDGWGKPSGEFLAACVALLALPFGLVRLRHGLRRLGDHHASDPSGATGQSGHPGSIDSMSKSASPP
jgi:potassium efflux system protein